MKNKIARATIPQNKPSFITISPAAGGVTGGATGGGETGGVGSGSHNL